MHPLGVVFVDVIVALFFVGLVGSSVVIVISFVEDFHELFGQDDSQQEPALPPRSTLTVPANAHFAAPKSSAR